jgi:hypothetical protein
MVSITHHLFCVALLQATILKLAHAGEGTEEYGDQSGMMGYSYSEDSTKMCFNPAKSWQLGWYSDKRIELDMKARGPFSGELIGLLITKIQMQQTDTSTSRLMGTAVQVTSSGSAVPKESISAQKKVRIVLPSRGSREADIASLRV